MFNTSCLKFDPGLEFDSIKELVCYLQLICIERNKKTYFYCISYILLDGFLQDGSGFIREKGFIT